MGETWFPPSTRASERCSRRAGGSLVAERGDGPPQAVVELDLGLPAEDLLRARDVGLPHLRVVDGERLVHDRARRARDAEDGLGELEQGPLLGVPDVDRKMLL